MKTNIIVLFSLLFIPVGFTLNTFGADHTPEQNRAAKEFAFEEVRLGATISEIKTKYTSLEFDKDGSDLKVGLATWTTYHSKSADSIDFILFNEKLYKMAVHYGFERASKLGGYETIHEKLVAKYGWG